jgi:hypothetical protein
MSHFIKAGHWALKKVGYKGELDLEKLIQETALSINTAGPINSQLIVASDISVENFWAGQTVIFTNNCTLTIPSGILDTLMFTGRTLAGVIVTFNVEGSLFLEPSTTAIYESQLFSFVKVKNSDMIILDQFNVYVPTVYSPDK